MPIKNVEFSKTVSVRLTEGQYNILRVMGRTYGNDADVLRAGLMALWREYQDLPSAEEVPPAPADADAGEGD